MPRFHVPLHLSPGAELELPAGAARHVQVLRMQPGQEITIFDGESDGEWTATILKMGRSSVSVRVARLHEVQREPIRPVHLAMGVPANDRMDWLVEKATELGAASLQPLMTAHAVVRLSGERAERKQQHWHAIAASACEQCGGNRLPLVAPARTLTEWLATGSNVDGGATTGPQTIAHRYVLSLREGTRPLCEVLPSDASSPVLFLSGPEGGLSPDEETLAMAHGFQPVTLGPRVLRAETAALTALAQSLA